MNGQDEPIINQENAPEPLPQEIPAISDQSVDQSLQPVEVQPETPPAPARRPGFFKRALNFLFNPETRFGRTMRAVTRTLAMVVGFFALGFLVAYLVLYTPTDRSLTAARSEVQSLQTQLTSVQSSFETTRNDLLQAQKRTGIQQTRIQVLSVLDLAQTARLALSTKVAGDTAQKSVRTASTQLEQALPAIKNVDPDAAVALKTRLELILNEVASDPKTAIADLNIFIEGLQLLDQKLGR
jgi:hypothetical protein